jgi:uncharacterized membrane protein
MPLIPVLLATHIILALSLLVPAILLPFSLRLRTAGSEPSRFTRGMIRIQKDFSLWIGLGLAASGIALLLAVGPALLAQPWLAFALVIYAADLAVAFVIQRPGLRRLFRLPVGESEAERDRWKALARTQRYLSYVMAGAIGLIAFLMMTKPTF